MKNFYLVILILFATISGFAQHTILLYDGGNVIYSEEIGNIDSICFPNSVSILHNNLGEVDFQYPTLAIDSITFVEGDFIPDSTRIVYIVYNNNSVTVINPLSNLGVTVTTNGADVLVNSVSALSDIIYHLSGVTTDGSLSISSNNRFNLTFSNVSITNPTGAAIKIPLDVKVNVTLEDNSINTLIDGSVSTDKAAFDSEGELIFYGTGSLTVTGNAKHGIFSNDYVRVINGNITVTNAVTDGIHGDYFQMYNGSLNITAGSDGIDGDVGFVSIEGGTINITAASEDSKAIKCDSVIEINGGNVTLIVSGNQAKGLKSSSSIVLNGGEINITASGTTVLTTTTSGNDPSYCVGIKSDNSIEINEGVSLTITCPSSNVGGKAISADGDITINGGYMVLTTAGNGATYTVSGSTRDSYTASCIKGDGNVYIYGGNISCSSSGTGGKGINAGASLTIGYVGGEDEELTLTVTTTGERFLVGSSGGWGGSADYANPKAIKSEAGVTINSGTISVTCTQSNEGGECIESETQLVINGGNIDAVSSRDDAINASQITINGGVIYAKSSNNDAIDANGTLTINGGLIVASGSTAPECAFDCDNYTFAINGGVLIGTGGNVSTPTSSACSQRSLSYSTSSNTALCLMNSSNEEIFIFKVPVYSTSGGGGGGGWPPGGGGGSGINLLFSSPSFSAGSYTLKYGGTISGGTNFHDYYTGATYTGGSTKTFSTGSGMVTTVN